MPAVTCVGEQSAHVRVIAVADRLVAVQRRPRRVFLGGQQRQRYTGTLVNSPGWVTGRTGSGYALSLSGSSAQYVTTAFILAIGGFYGVGVVLSADPDLQRLRQNHGQELQRRILDGRK
jgi:hypothetical protein